MTRSLSPARERVLRDSCTHQLTNRPATPAGKGMHSYGAPPDISGGRQFPHSGRLSPIRQRTKPGCKENELFNTCLLKIENCHIHHQIQKFEFQLAIDRTQSRQCNGQSWRAGGQESPRKFTERIRAGTGAVRHTPGELSCSVSD